MTDVSLEVDPAQLEKARGEIFAALDRCPCCGAARTNRSSGRALQNVEFACGAIFFRLSFMSPQVSQACQAPSRAAMKALEIEAAKAAAKAVAL